LVFVNGKLMMMKEQMKNPGEEEEKGSRMGKEAQAQDQAHASCDWLGRHSTHNSLGLLLLFLSFGFFFSSHRLPSLSLPIRRQSRSETRLTRQRQHRQ
jgi:hypothetical protein